MHIQQGIDFRDQNWEDDKPVFRTFIWTNNASTQEAAEWSCIASELTGVDVDYALSWLRQQAGEKPASLWVLTRDGSSLGAIKLFGISSSDLQY